MWDKSFNFRKKLFILSSILVVYFSISTDKSSNLDASEIISVITTIGVLSINMWRKQKTFNVLSWRGLVLITIPLLVILIKLFTINSPEQNRSFYISFPYFGPYSDKLSNELSNLFRKYFRNIDFKIIMTNPFKISSLFFFKDKLPKHMRASVVYKFSCVQCTFWVCGCHHATPSTAELLSIVAEVSRTNRLLTTRPHSNIRDHTFNCHSPITLENFTILKFMQIWNRFTHLRVSVYLQN